MFRFVFTSFRGYKAVYLKNDIPAGVMVAALTIPVAMGYAQVAGMPPVYGLYASMLPVLGYILFASSPQLVFGVDAGGAAVTGSALAATGIALGSRQAVAAAPVLALFAGAFLLAFAALRLGKLSAYISRPVMSGFLSGISLSIIFGQLPKIAGLPSAGSDFFGNIKVFFTDAADISPLSVLLGLSAALLVVLGRRFLRRLPVALFVLALATLLSWALGFAQMGVAVVGDIPKGFPPFALPDVLHAQNLPMAAGYGLATAVVVFASSLLAADSFAVRGGYELSPNRELLAYGTSCVLASLNGCPPTSGSISRTAASVQFGAKTQMVSVVSVALTALVVALLGGVLYYMPQPVLGGIVLAAMLGVVEVKPFRRLLQRSRREAFILLGAAVGVLLVGVLAGVLVGVLLSFIDVIMRITSPPRAFLGTVPGRAGFYDLATHKNALEVPGVVVYRFSARLFFANARFFTQDVKKAVIARKPKLLVVDAEGVNDVDTTAVEELKGLFGFLRAQKVDYCIAGQTGRVTRRMRELGLREFLDGAHTAETVEKALAAHGF